jgi:hypothetical protein
MKKSTKILLGLATTNLGSRKGQTLNSTIFYGSKEGHCGLTKVRDQHYIAVAGTARERKPTAVRGEVEIGNLFFVEVC